MPVQLDGGEVYEQDEDKQGWHLVGTSSIKGFLFYGDKPIGTIDLTHGAIALDTVVFGDKVYPVALNDILNAANAWVEEKENK